MDFENGDIKTLDKEKNSLTIKPHIAEATSKPKQLEVDASKSVSLAESGLRNSIFKNSTIASKITNQVPKKVQSQTNSISQKLTKASTEININRNTVEKVDIQKSLQFTSTAFYLNYFIN